MGCGEGPGPALLGAIEADPAVFLPGCLVVLGGSPHLCSTESIRVPVLAMHLQWGSGPRWLSFALQVAQDPALCSLVPRDSDPSPLSPLPITVPMGVAWALNLMAQKAMGGKPSLYQVATSTLGPVWFTVGYAQGHQCNQFGLETQASLPGSMADLLGDLCPPQVILIQCSRLLSSHSFWTPGHLAPSPTRTPWPFCPSIPCGTVRS